MLKAKVEKYCPKCCNGNGNNGQRNSKNVGGVGKSSVILVAEECDKHKPVYNRRIGKILLKKGDHKNVKGIFEPPVLCRVII